MHRKSKMSLICCSYCKYFSVFSPLSSLEHPPGAATDVCEGARLWAVSASSQNLHRCHLQPARQPAVCLFFFCLNALVGLRISVIWCSHLKLLQSLPTHTHNITPPPALSLCLVLFLAFPSRTCQTDHASSCTNFGRTVSPGWGRCRGPSWPIRFETWEFQYRTEILLSVSSCSPALFEAFAALPRGIQRSHPFHPSFPSATCSRPSVRPSSAALSTRWRSLRWCPPCCSQVETSRLQINLTMRKISHESSLIWSMVLLINDNDSQ